MTTAFNWAGNVSWTPTAIRRPASVDEVIGYVADAQSTASSVRVRGAGHSFAPLCATDGVTLDLSLMSGVIAIDDQAATVTAYAGTRLHDLTDELFNHGLALHNQGDVDVQTLAGAIQTGTHGTGRAHRSLSAEVTAMDVVAPAHGLVHLASDDRRLCSAALALGLGGVVTSVTLSVAPAFKLRETSQAVPWQGCWEVWSNVESSARNAEMYWLPTQDQCVIKAFTDTDEATTTTGRAIPAAAPGTVERYLSPPRVAWSHNAYPSVRTVPFVEMEYAVPLLEGPAVLAELRSVMQHDHPEITWAVEYRTQGGDDLALSPTQGVDVATISVHARPEQQTSALFGSAQRLFRSAHGRPHWGKLQTVEAIDERDYSRLNQFREYVQWGDPTNVLGNRYTASVTRLRAQ